MTRLVQIPAEYLATIAEGSDRIPRLYYARNRILRRMFWERLHCLNRLMQRVALSTDSCLDFGGGSGVFLPTLAQRFGTVTLLDLEARQARQVAERYRLNNVEIVEDDAGAVDFAARPFDAVVAADVLEHFQDLDLPVTRLHRWLKPGGMLFTSLPTENWVYVMLRKIFGIEKPLDHYHTGPEVEARLGRSGFHRMRSSYVPLGLPVAPLFLITAWRRV
jgi:2-polyprenyl-3-methyl-5-hydroxy-6-metoxy-1,4-benzoquinol methylase